MEGEDTGQGLDPNRMGGHKGCLRLWIQITINLSYAPSWPAIIMGHPPQNLDEILATSC